MSELLAVRIGQGAKLHSAIKAPGGFMFTCGCPCTMNGRAEKKATIFANEKPNCREA